MPGALGKITGKLGSGTFSQSGTSNVVIGFPTKQFGASWYQEWMLPVFLKGMLQIDTALFLPDSMGQSNYGSWQFQGKDKKFSLLLERSITHSNW